MSILQSELRSLDHPHQLTIGDSYRTSSIDIFLREPEM